MATEADERERRPLRTVTAPVRGHPDADMNVIGWAIALTLAVLVLPILPIAIAYVVGSWLIDRVWRQQ